MKSRLGFFSQRPNDEEWQDVPVSRRQRQKGDYYGRRNERDETKTRFFVSNLPDGTGRKEMAEFFGEFGEVTEVYVARKRDKNGKVFGFVTFRQVKDKKDLEKRLNGAKIGSFKIFVTVAKFSAEYEEVPAKVEKTVKGEEDRSRRLGGSFPKSKMGQPWGKSFRDVLLNNDSDQLRDTEIVIPSELCALESLFGKALVGRTVDFLTLRSLKEMMVKAGVGGLNIHYIGGFYVLLSFEDETEAKSFVLNNEMWKSWFSVLDMWYGQSLPFERIAWLKIQGVPLHLTDMKVFNSIGDRFGKVVHDSQIAWNDGDLSVDCVGILIGDGEIISETVTLKWRGKAFKAWVREEGGDWLPDCVGKVVKQGEEVHGAPAAGFGGEGEVEKVAENEKEGNEGLGGSMEGDSRKKGEEQEMANESEGGSSNDLYRESNSQVYYFIAGKGNICLIRKRLKGKKVNKA